MITKNGIFSIYFDIKPDYIWVEIKNTENGNITSSAINIVNGKIDWIPIILYIILQKKINYTLKSVIKILLLFNYDYQK